MIHELCKRLFREQTLLMQGFQRIEGLPDWPIDPSTFAGQQLIRDFLGRFTEELVEAHDALPNEQPEELIDCLHFLLELAIFVGISWEQVAQRLDRHHFEPPFHPIPRNDLQFAIHLAVGRLRHGLKTKPWRQTQASQSVSTIQNQVIYLFVMLLDLWFALGYSFPDLEKTFMRKVDINVQRMALQGVRKVDTQP